VVWRGVGGAARGDGVAASVAARVVGRGVRLSRVFGLLGGLGSVGDRGTVVAAPVEQYDDHRDDQHDDDDTAGDDDPQSRVVLPGLLGGLSVVLRRVGRLVGVLRHAALAGVGTRSVPHGLLSAGTPVPVGGLVGAAVIAGLSPGVGIGLPALGAVGASVRSGLSSWVALATGVLRWLGVGSVVAHDSPRAGLVMSGLRRVLTLSWFRCWWSRDRWDGSTGAKSCAHDKALRSYPSIRMRAASPFRG